MIVCHPERSEGSATNETQKEEAVLNVGALLLYFRSFVALRMTKGQSFVIQNDSEGSASDEKLKEGTVLKVDALPLCFRSFVVLRMTKG